MTTFQRQGNRQLAVNMLSGVMVFFANLCISFFLTPYIVEKLGTVAYGFIGLSNNIIGYSSLLTVAVNSMAGRFISVRVHGGDIDGANRYMSSVFYTNVIISVLILVGVAVSAYFLDSLINVPPALLSDVRLLYIMLGLSTGMGLLTGVFSVGTFIINRIEISNLRNIIGTLIRTVLILSLFGFFVPRLWYFGVTALVMNLYIMSSNYLLFKRLTPFLVIRRSYFSFTALIEIAASGIWNIVNKISNLLTRGCELLLTNLFINPRSMGQLSIAHIVPSLILGFFGTICYNFAPEFTRLYAQGKLDILKAELNKSIKITGFICALPLSLFYAFGDVFYSLWVPAENIKVLYLVSVVSSLELISGMPQESLWNIFPVTDNVRKSSLCQLFYAILTFVSIIIPMYYISDEFIKLMIVAGVHSFYCIVRNLTFLPQFGASCLGFNKKIFYPVIFKAMVNILLATAIGFVVKYLFFQRLFVFGISGGESEMMWLILAVALAISGIIALAISYFTILDRGERKMILSKLPIFR